MGIDYKKLAEVIEQTREHMILTLKKEDLMSKEELEKEVDRICEEMEDE